MLLSHTHATSHNTPARTRTGALFLAALALGASASSLPAQRVEGFASDETVKMDKYEVNEGQAEAALPLTTATRLPLSVRQTPQSISTLNRVRMDEESLFSVNDVLKDITGVTVSFWDTQRPLYFARGFQITDFQVDGLPVYSNSTNQEYDTVFYDRVEVIRGANGLLSGTGIPSATVNMLRKRPLKTFSASLSATVGSWDLHRTEGDVSIPLTSDGRVRSRIVGAYQERRSYLDRYSDEKKSFMGVVEADLGPKTTLSVGYQRQENDPKAGIWGTIPRFASDGSLANLPRSFSFSPSWVRWSRESDTLFSSVEHKLGDSWVLKAAYNRTEGETFSLRTYGTGGFPNPVTGAGMKLLAGVGEAEDTRDSFDLYASGKFTLLNRQHDLVVGWNYTNLESFTPTFTSVAAWSYTIPNIWTWDGEAPAPTYSKTGAFRIATTRQSGLYASARLRPFEDLSVIGGGRLSSWRTGTRAYGTTGDYVSTTGAYEVQDKVTPYVGVVYDLDKTWSAYASYTDIFQPQNYKDKDNNLLDPVLGKNFEGGLKAEFFAKRFQVSLAAFETRQDNYAVRDATQPDNSLPDGSSAYVGVNGTRSRGYELELSGYIRPGWTVSAGYTHVYTRRHAADLIWANLPKDLVQLSTNYRFPGSWNRLSVGAGVTWQGEVFGYNIPHPTLGTVTVREGSYALYNFHAGYRLTKNLSLNVSVRNAFDKLYWATLDYPNYGEPRNVLATVRWHF